MGRSHHEAKHIDAPCVLFLFAIFVFSLFRGSNFLKQPQSPPKPLKTAQVASDRSPRRPRRPLIQPKSSPGAPQERPEKRNPNLQSEPARRRRLPIPLAGPQQASKRPQERPRGPANTPQMHQEAPIEAPNMTKDIREALQETPNRGPTTFPRTAPAHTRWLQDIRGEVDLKHPTTLWSTPDELPREAALLGPRSCALFRPI